MGSFAIFWNKDKNNQHTFSSQYFWIIALIFYVFDIIYLGLLYVLFLKGLLKLIKKTESKCKVVKLPVKSSQLMYSQSHQVMNRPKFIITNPSNINNNNNSNNNISDLDRIKQKIRQNNNAKSSPTSQYERTHNTSVTFGDDITKPKIVEHNQTSPVSPNSPASPLSTSLDMHDQIALKIKATIQKQQNKEIKPIINKPNSHQKSASLQIASLSIDDKKNKTTRMEQHYQSQKKFGVEYATRYAVLLSIASLSSLLMIIMIIIERENLLNDFERLTPNIIFAIDCAINSFSVYFYFVFGKWLYDILCGTCHIMVGCICFSNV